MDASQLNALLNQLLLPDTAQVKQAELSLKPYLKNPQCLGGLLEQIQSNQNPGVRQISAVILRKRVHAHWGKLDPTSQATLQNAVLAILQSEGERAVRKAVITVACVIARPCFANPETRWMVLLEFVNACCGAPQEEAKEMGFLLIEHLAEVIATSLPEAIQSLVALLHNGLMDAMPMVQAAALRATGQLMNALSTNEGLIVFADMIPPMLEVLKARCASGDEDVVTQVLEVFDELAESPVAVLNKHVPTLVAFLLEMVKAPALDHSMRDQAGMVLGSLAEFKPKLLGKKKLVPSILEAMVFIMAETNDSCAGSLYLALDDNQSDPNAAAAEEDDEDDEEDKGRSPCQTAQTCIDKLACSLSMKYVWESGLQLSCQCLQMAESNWKKAGASCLGNLAEGCQDPLREVLEQVLPLVIAAAQDPNQYTREAACFCFGQMAEHCQPEIMRYQMEILPVVFPLLDDKLQSVQGISCYVLEMFSEHLNEKTVAPLLNDLTTKLVHLLTNSPRLSIREMSCSCLASTAAAAEKQFLPYTEAVVNCLVEPLRSMDPSQVTLRGRALECLGHIAIAIGNEHFAPYLPLGMSSAEQSLQLDEPELHEFTYSFFGTTSRVMGAGFAHFVPTLVPHLCEVVARSDTTEVNIGEHAEGFDFTTGLEEEEGEEGQTVLTVRTALMDVKRTAVIALGMIAENVGPCFGEFLKNSLTVLLVQKDYFHDKIRIEIVKAMGRMVKAAVACCFGEISNMPKFQAGSMEYVAGCNEVVVHVANTVVKTLLVYLYYDEHKMVASQACESLQNVLEMLGPAVLGQCMQPAWYISEQEGPCPLSAMQIILQLLHEKAPCQMAPIESLEQQLEDDEDDDADHDNVLMDNVADLIGALAKVFGPSFVNFSAEFFDAMMKFSKASRPSSDRAMAIGCFAEMIQFMGCQQGNQHIPVVLPAIQLGLSDKALGVCRNAAFGIGMIAESTPELIKPYVPSILNDLRPMFDLSHDMDSAVADNAASAVARLLVHCGDVVPFEQVLPVFLKALPLKSDFSENDNVYKCLATLFQYQNPVLLSPENISLCLFGISNGLRADQVEEETRNMLVQSCKTNFNDPNLNALLMSTMSTFPQDVTEAIQLALQ